MEWMVPWVETSTSLLLKIFSPAIQYHLAILIAPAFQEATALIQMLPVTRVQYQIIARIETCAVQLNAPKEHTATLRVFSFTPTALQALSILLPAPSTQLLACLALLVLIADRLLDKPIPSTAPQALSIIFPAPPTKLLACFALWVLIADRLLDKPIPPSALQEHSII